MLRATVVAAALVAITATAEARPRKPAPTRPTRPTARRPPAAPTPPPVRPGNPADARRLGRAYEAYQAGDLDGARQLLRGLGPDQLANPDYLLWVRGQVALQAGRPADARPDFTALAKLTTSRLAAAAPWRLADCLWEQGRRAEAARAYGALLGNGNADDHADLGVVAYRMARAAGSPAAEQKGLRALLLAYPGHPLAPEAERRLVELGGALGWDGEDRIARAQRLTVAHLWHEAVAELMLVPDGAAEGTRLRRDYWLGTTLYKMRRRYGDAGKLLLSVAPRMDSAEALFHGARALSRSDQDDQAIVRYREVVAKYPRTDWAAEAQYLTGWLEFNRGNYRKAIAPLEEMLRRYPTSKWMDDALWFLGMSHFLLGQYDRALPHLDKLAGRGAAYEGGKGLYWWARTVDRLGRRADAIDAYQRVVARWPFAWYALLAQTRLREAGVTIGPFGARPPAPRGPTVATRLEPTVEADPAIVRFDELERAGLDVDAGKDLTRGERAFVKRHDRAAALAVLFERYGRGSNWTRPWKLALAYDGGALDTPPQGPARFWWQHAYPEAYQPLVDKYQALGKSPPYYLYAIMRKESGYDPHVLSYADAQGLLQMIPPTTIRVARQLGITYAAGDLYAPEVNVRTASWYIGNLLQKFKGQIPFGAASFNSGPRPVMKWLDQHGTRPIDELVELVSYMQTREYMKLVTENYARYVYLYTGTVYEQPMTVDPGYLVNELTY